MTDYEWEREWVQPLLARGWTRGGGSRAIYVGDPASPGPILYRQDGLRGRVNVYWWCPAWHSAPHPVTTIEEALAKAVELALMYDGQQ